MNSNNNHYPPPGWFLYRFRSNRHEVSYDDELVEWNKLNAKKRYNEIQKMNALLSQQPNFWKERFPDKTWEELSREAKIHEVVEMETFWNQGNFGKRKFPVEWRNDPLSHTEYHWKLKSDAQQVQIIQSLGKKKKKFPISVSSETAEEDIPRQKLQKKTFLISKTMIMTTMILIIITMIILAKNDIIKFFNQ